MQLQHIHDFDAYFRLNEALDAEARDKVRGAITLILVNLPFFASILIRLWVFEDKNCKTMYTNGKSIAYSPDFVKSLKAGEVAWVLVHEIMHNVLLHFSRTRPNAKLWNIATDYAINLLIEKVSDDTKAAERFTMPKGGLFDPKYKDMSADAIYDYLEQNPQQQPKQGSFNNFGEVGGDTMEIDPDSVVQAGDTGNLNDDADGDGEGDEGDEQDGKGKGKGQDGEEDPNGKPAKPVPGGKKPGKIVIGKATEAEMQNAVSQGLSKASSAIRRYYDLMFKPQIDWKKELKKYIQQIFDKIKYKLPYRRFAHTGTYLTGPVKGGESIDSVVVAIDTSGSIDAEMINEFLTEVAGMIAAYKLENLVVISIDDKIRTVNKFKSPRDLKTLKVDIKGGGGTDFIPVFDYIEDVMRKKFSVLIYITDAMGSFPTPAPAYANKVIWCVKGTGSVPFGKRVQLGD